MQTDEDVGKVAAAVPVIICILSVFLGHNAPKLVPEWERQDYPREIDRMVAQWLVYWPLKSRLVLEASGLIPVGSDRKISVSEHAAMTVIKYGILHPRKPKPALQTTRLEPLGTWATFSLFSIRVVIQFNI